MHNLIRYIVSKINSHKLCIAGDIQHTAVQQQRKAELFSEGPICIIFGESKICPGCSLGVGRTFLFSIFEYIMQHAAMAIRASILNIESY